MQIAKIKSLSCLKRRALKQVDILIVKNIKNLTELFQAQVELNERIATHWYRAISLYLAQIKCLIKMLK